MEGADPDALAKADEALVKADEALAKSDKALAKDDEALAKTAAKAAAAAASKAGIIYDSSMERHAGPEVHKEQPRRIIETFEKLESAGLFQRCTQRQMKSCFGATHWNTLKV
eukprot:gene24837-10488_t